MDPFITPGSGSGSWIEFILAAGGALVLLIYFYQVFWTRISDAFVSKPDYAERAAELAREYQRQKAGKSDLES